MTQNIALKGTKIRKLPNIMIFSLNRFQFDFEKMDRVKINDKFQFGLEINMSPFIETYDGTHTSEENDYELFCVLIHRGDAYQGTRGP